MYGGIATAGADQILYAQHDGDLFLIDVESGDLLDLQTPHPFCPAKIELSACAVAPDGSYLLADSLHHRVRRLDAQGGPLGLIGRAPVAGIRQEDEAGVIADPVALLPVEDGVVAVSGGEDQEHAVQRFDFDGTPRASFAHPTGGFFRAHGIARMGEEIWVAETVGGAIRRFAPDGTFLGDTKLHVELQRPFRLVADGYGGVLLLLAPESEEEQDVSGVARIAPDGSFEGWIVPGGEEPGHVHLPFDIAVLPDGRFVVADLPLGAPPDVRLQLFAADGTLKRVLVSDRMALEVLKDAWRESYAGAQAETAEEMLALARLEHFFRGSDAEAAERAALLYRAATAMDPADPRPRAGMGDLLQHGAGRPLEAIHEFEEAIAAGAPEADFRARIAECRHAAGDLDGAIALLGTLLDEEDLPEEAPRLLDELGSWFLQRAGEDPEV